MDARTIACRRGTCRPDILDGMALPSRPGDPAATRFLDSDVVAVVVAMPDVVAWNHVIMRG